MNPAMGPFKTMQSAVRWYRSEGFVTGATRCKRCRFMDLLVARPGEISPFYKCQQCGGRSALFYPDPESRDDGDNNEHEEHH